MPSIDLDSLRRSTDLVEYARARGYQERPREALPGITVLEHPMLGERIAVARLASGGIYAQVNAYAPRGALETEDAARARLRDCIARSPDTGSVVEFVQRRGRAPGQPAPSLAEVADHLRLWKDLRQRLGQDFLERPNPSRLHERLPPQLEADGGAAGDTTAPRVERWRQAQAAIDAKIAEARALDARSPPLSPALASPHAPSPLARRREVAERRYDWSPQPARDLTLPHVPRRSGPERGR